MPVVEFLKLLFGSFFRWWWALITGFVTIASLYYKPSGIHLGPISLGIITLGTFTLLFLVLSAIYQGWLLYQNCLTAPAVLRCQRSDSYEGELVFLIEVSTPIAVGKVAELRRFRDGIEMPIALVEFMEQNSQGQFQARPVWISPGHLRNLKMNQFMPEDIVVDLSVQYRTLEAARDHLIAHGG